MDAISRLLEPAALCLLEAETSNRREDFGRTTNLAPSADTTRQVRRARRQVPGREQARELAQSLSGERIARVWTSDCNDAFERQTIQRWATTFVPPEVLAPVLTEFVLHG